MEKITLLAALLLIAGLAGWLSRYKISYYYNVWQMEHSVEASERSACNARIQALSDKTGKSSFINTYEDTTNKNRVRRAAATALIKSDPAVAERLFAKYINSTNPDVSGMAIRNLGTMKSRTFRNEILQKRNSDNELVRWCVVEYLGNFRDAEDMTILKSIRDNDKSEMVKSAADDLLKDSSKQSGN